MINAIKLCINHSTRVRKLGITGAPLHLASGYNVLIGPNGSGKSTVLNAIASCRLCTVEKTDDDPIKYITTETLNPLVGGTFASREEMVQGIRAMFLSHGKGVLDSLGSQSHAGETIILIDSPETGQDLENSESIHKGLLKMSERYQVIVATNSLVFMRGGNLIDLGEDYLPRLVKATSNLAASFILAFKQGSSGPSRAGGMISTELGGDAGD
ncbi:MAG: AAA family ATPase [Acidobacteria bacterium]|nr:AAA family ATPase [Acidobacteriota bacterium]